MPCYDPTPTNFDNALQREAELDENERLFGRRADNRDIATAVACEAIRTIIDARGDVELADMSPMAQAWWERHQRHDAISS